MNESRKEQAEAGRRKKKKPTIEEQLAWSCRNPSGIVGEMWQLYIYIWYIYVCICGCL
jgi:hypothetical protein